MISVTDWRWLKTVIPGFEFADHDFLEGADFQRLVPDLMKHELKWLVRSA